MAGASDFKFGKQLGFVKAHHKTTHRRKCGHGPGLGELRNIWGSPSIFTQWLKLQSSNFLHSLGLPRPTIKPHQRKSGRVLGIWNLPNIWCSRLIFLQRLRCPLIVSRACFKIVTGGDCYDYSISVRSLPTPAVFHMNASRYHGITAVTTELQHYCYCVHCSLEQLAKRTV